ncbi:hypothetical protein K450DRAFT_235178 [Umbelopsis ramanniana AG]|uniref:Band 7 domain-containing protein n=1 Tax=Umbelopsis ramanniana AG TaxID=1314678 RepID=A0AAD5EDC3_UMBRA|nr:uncharacterized protein K450DRAFT_235178 [Umbelopsis ramanniana AG]KAI8580910.1 hypothetical protein K450DRAFT_235178 [Umbelopsis ramanniana AG]
MSSRALSLTRFRPTLSTPSIQRSVNLSFRHNRAILLGTTKRFASYGNYGYGNEYDSFGNSGVSGGWGTSRRSLPRNTIIKFVPQQEAWIIERMGKFHRLLEPGLNFLVPLIDRIKYVKSMKETAVEVPSQSAITQDNVTLELDGVLYFRVIDPFKACYGVEDAEFAVTQLAQTTMRAEIGQMTLDRTLAERAHLNANIVDAINGAAEDWGIRCLRYEIRDIHPPSKVVESMHQQVSAERTKRAQILESEGARQAAINVAEGRKQATILASEAEKAEQINKAGGEAEAILLKAKATALGIEKVAEAIGNNNGNEAVSMSVAEKYVEAFGKMAKEGTTLIVPATANDAGSMVAQALSVYNTINKARIPSRQASNSYVSAAEKMKEETTRDFVNAAKKNPDNLEDQ